MSRPATPPVGSASGSPSLPAGAWSTRRHTTPRARTAPHARHHTHSDRGTLVSCPGWSPTTRGTHPALADPSVSRPDHPPLGAAHHLITMEQGH